MERVRAEMAGRPSSQAQEARRETVASTGAEPVSEHSHVDEAAVPLSREAPRWRPANRYSTRVVALRVRIRSVAHRVLLEREGRDAFLYLLWLELRQ